MLQLQEAEYKLFNSVKPAPLKIIIHNVTNFHNYYIIFLKLAISSNQYHIMQLMT